MTEPNQGPAGSQPLGSDQFARYLAQRLTIHEDTVTVLERDGLTLRLRLRERETSVDLTQFYNAYRAHPDQIDAVARTFEHVLLDETPERDVRDFSALAERVFPMLKPIELLVTVRERNLPMLVYREFLGDLMIAYVIDEGQSVSYINEEHLDRWNVSTLDLHERALENLRRRTLEATKYMTTGEDERRLFIFSSGDGYDATRLLLTQTLASWAQQVPGRLVIGVPTRDFLIAFSDADDEVLRSIAAQVQTDAMNETTGLTDQLFTLQGGQVRVYDWD